jgi:exopolyphosphatase/guanosine-5'-triphosphate,3'-diphosphate pyrophosphatase
MKMSRKLASIDIGTNTFRLLVCEIRKNQGDNTYSLNEIHSMRAVVRLGEGVSAGRRLNREAISRSVRVLRQFMEAAAKYEVSAVRAVATSALREASNGDDFIARAQDEAGIDVKIISGEEEARLTALGMLFDLDIPASALLIDIGGGSTELIFTRHKAPLKFGSRKIGVVYLAEKYMLSDPPAADDIRGMEDEIMCAIEDYARGFRKLTDDSTVLIGTAGTITALSAMSLKLDRYDRQQVHHSTLTLTQVEETYNALAAASSAERQRLMPFEPQRLDIIVPGAFILLSLMRVFNKKDLTVSDYGLREGILIDMYQKQTSGACL